MQNKARFWDKIAEKYSKQPVADEAAYQKKLDITRTYFRPDMEVLEFGCGTGSTALAHAPYVKHIHAIDISENMIGIAKAKAEAANITNVTFEQGDIDTANLAGTSFDAVMAHSILHLVEDRDAVIAKVHNMLKPGGVFISSTICIAESWLKLIALVAPLGRLFGLLPMVRSFTNRQLIDSMTGAGFTIDHEWRPGNTKATFIVAKKAE